MAPIHTIAQVGFGPGTNHLYDRVRPSYQPFALEFILSAVKSKSQLNIVEIGSGTGIFTRALLADPQWNAAIKQIKAIEPSEGMRSFFSQAVKDDRVTVAEGTFDATGIPEGWANLVVIAQAFHWCPDYGAASAEFSRILRPNGTVAFVWNLHDRDGARWVAKVGDIIGAHEQNTPQFRHMYWRQTFDTPSYRREFNPPEEKKWDYKLHANKEIIVDRAASASYIVALSDDERAEVQEEIKKVIDQGLDKVWIDEAQGSFEYPYKTWVVIAHKK
ncbi:S-adenosyl-L-methionine-dependent methyltransferase [Phlegmacium glaucopus]|nr:S-adenosyl-L-methionine-dependent methyltransferase [Phlegmacium glaucopus]